MTTKPAGERFLEITDGVVTGGAFVCHDLAFVDEMGWVGPVDGMQPEPGIGWAYDGETFSPPPEAGQT